MGNETANGFKVHHSCRTSIPTKNKVVELKDATQEELKLFYDHRNNAHIWVTPPKDYERPTEKETVEPISE